MGPEFSLCSQEFPLFTVNIIILIIIMILVFLVSLIAQIKETTVTAGCHRSDEYFTEVKNFFYCSIRVPSKLRTFPIIVRCLRRFSCVWQ